MGKAAKLTSVSSTSQCSSRSHIQKLQPQFKEPLKNRRTSTKHTKRTELTSFVSNQTTAASYAADTICKPSGFADIQQMTYDIMQGTIPMQFNKTECIFQEYGPEILRNM